MPDVPQTASGEVRIVSLSRITPGPEFNPPTARDPERFAQLVASVNRRLTDDERAQRRAHDRERLEQSARELLSSDGWRRWIEIRARNGLARYSLIISMTGVIDPV